MDFCTCKITLAGDYRSQVHIPKRSAVSYAEILLLRFMHGGQDTVQDIRVVENRPTSPTQEKNYLLGKYGKVVEQLYPGVTPNMEMRADADPFYEGSELTDAEPVGQPRKRGPGRPPKNREPDPAEQFPS